MTPAGTSNELDVQNGWEENTHTHTGILFQCKQRDVVVAAGVVNGCLLFIRSRVQDQVPGLQILIQGKWVDVHPRPGAFICNIGDMLQTW